MPRLFGSMKLLGDRQRAYFVQYIPGMLIINHKALIDRQKITPEEKASKHNELIKKIAFLFFPKIQGA